MRPTVRVRGVVTNVGTYVQQGTKEGGTGDADGFPSGQTFVFCKIEGKAVGASRAARSLAGEADGTGKGKMPSRRVLRGGNWSVADGRNVDRSGCRCSVHGMVRTLLDYEATDNGTIRRCFPR